MSTVRVLNSTYFDPFKLSYSSKTTEPQSSKRKFSKSSNTTTLNQIPFNMTYSPVKRSLFDVSKDLDYIPPRHIYSMAEIGRQGQGISPNAVSLPFSLFTQDAVMKMRREVLSREVLDNHQFSSNLAPCQVRGYGPHLAPFIHEVWNSPEVLKIVSDIAGIELVPVMDFEIGHVNISVPNKKTQADNQRAITEDKAREEDESIEDCQSEDEKPVVDWHTDSYPFVCVLMISDCSEMIGGETALRKGDGSIMKVRGPTMGHAVVLQGRYIEHQALRALGGAERITMVTSFRPKNPLVKDDTVLTTVRPVSNLSKLYGDYTEYRLSMLDERLRSQVQRNQAQKKSGRKFDTAGNKRFIAQQIDFLQSMLTQMVDERGVVAGVTDSTHLLSDDLRTADEVNTKAYLEKEE